MSSVAVRKAWYDSTNSLYEDDSPPDTGENTRQTKLYNFDPRMAHPKYGEDLAAMRATDEEVLGSGLKPTAQPRHNIEWEEGVSESLNSNPRYSDEEMHEVTHHGVKYLMRPDGKVQFPIKEGDKGIWLTRPTESDASPGGLFTNRDADKLVFVRGKSKSLRGMGRAYERNSDEAREKVAEMFLQRKKPIDPDRLVEVPIPKNKQMWQVLRDLGLTGGTDKHGRSKWGSKIPIKKALQLLKMSDYEADEYQDRLEERANRRFDPKSRRKIQSMGQRESKPPVHNLPGLNRKTMRDRDLSRNLDREIAIMGLDLPSMHGFGGDDREIHPGEETNYTEEAWKKLQSHMGQVRTPNVGRSKRAVRIESPVDFSRLFGGQRGQHVGVRPGDYFYDDSFGSDDDDDDDESESASFSFGSDNDRNLFAAHLADIPQIVADDRSFWDDYEPSYHPTPSDIGEGIFENRKPTSGPINYIPQTEEWVNNPFQDIPTNWGIPFNEETGFTKGKPMEIAYQLLKDRKSPEAWAHKLEYDKQYQKNPKRVKYREQLNAERRKRGIYGKGGGDVSHTQGGKLTLESPHTNRARHFKGKGTLRRVKVK